MYYTNRQFVDNTPNLQPPAHGVEVLIYNLNEYLTG